MMTLCMSLQKFINSIAQRLLLPSRNTILRPSTKLLRKGAFMSLTLQNMSQPHLRIPHMRNKLTLIHLMMHPQMSLTQSWTKPTSPRGWKYIVTYILPENFINTLFQLPTVYCFIETQLPQHGGKQHSGFLPVVVVLETQDIKMSLM